MNFNYFCVSGSGGFEKLSLNSDWFIGILFQDHVVLGEITLTEPNIAC